MPTNLFDTVIKEAIINKLKHENIIFNDKLNYNKLFKLWWEKSRADITQEFYNAEREYTFDGEKLNFVINTKSKFEDYYKGAFLNKVYASKQKARIVEQKTNKRLPDVDKLQVERTLRNKIGTTEKLIRILQEEDRLMLLMFEQLLDSNLNLKLKDIETLLNETILVKQEISGLLPFDNFGEIIYDDNLKMQISKNITENRKRKEFSVLKKYVFDKRLPELFEYYCLEDISLELIKIELDSYNKVKDIVFDKTFILEQAIIIKDLEGVLKHITHEKGHIQHKPFLNWLQEKEIISPQDFTYLNMIRNAFSHNQYPQKTTMELFIKKWNTNNFANQIMEVYNLKIETILEKIAKID